MRISIFGLGYVGSVSAGCLANEGHKIIGVDPVQTKVDLINQGKTPIIEKDIGEIIQRAVKDGRLQGTTETVEAVKDTELSFICVGTPSQQNGNLDLKFIRRVCESIGSALKHKSDSHVVVIRSTILPGTMRNVILPTLEEYSGKKAGKDFELGVNPEFMREGSAVYDYYNPPKIVIGEKQKKCGDLLAKLYEKIDAPLIRTDIETAEMVKYVDNIWHSLKITFANEIGIICKSIGVDSHALMQIFCQDKKLNISPVYLKPGFAFGGSCLPKDLRAMTYKARSMDLDLPILDSILRSNRMQIERAIQLVTQKGNKKVGVFGFSFKAGTDDLRESPLVKVIERLIGKGYDIRLYDRNVNIASLTGANREYILNSIPHISKLMMATMDGVLEHGDTIVIGNADPEFKSVLARLRPGQIVVDLVRITEKYQGSDLNYEGICW